MAEARIEEEEEELRELREPGVRRNLRQPSPAAGRSERNKPERRLSSQGALSSIRSAIKRTSTRTHSQGDRSRERRRPEITILSAEPLATNAWFPGAPAGFPPPPPPTERIWGGSIPASAQPPPSYDQVIREKTQEQAPPPASAPRRVTTTIATQTDFVPEDEDEDATSDPQCSVTSQAVEKKESSGGRPRKPPRPSFPFKPKAPPSDTAVNSPVSLSEEQTVTGVRTAEAINSLLDTSCEFQSSSSTPGSDLQTEPPEPCLISLDFPPALAVASSALPAISEPGRPQEDAGRPTPRPRSRPVARDVKIQTLVRLRDYSEGVQESGGEVLSGKYLQELLDVFGPGDQFLSNQSDQSGESDQSEQNDLRDLSEEDIVSMLRTKIQAFEKQGMAGDAETGEPVKRPEPRPRAQHPKPPPVAARPAVPSKPSLAPTASDKASTEKGSTPGPKPETNNHKEASGPPTPAPRPLLPKKSPSESQSKDAPANLTRPPRPSVAARPKNHVARDESCTVSRPAPPVQSKALLDLLDLNSPPTDTAPNEVDPNCDNNKATSVDDVPESENKEAPANLTRPPRPSVAARPKNHVARDESCTVSRPAPPVQSKALLDLLDLNSPPTDTVPSEVGPDCDNIKSTSESENKEAPANLTRPPRPSVAARPKNHVAQDESCTLSRPAPPVQSKVVVDLLDLNSPPTDTAPNEVDPDCDKNKATSVDDVPESKNKEAPANLTRPPRPSVAARPKNHVARDESCTVSRTAPPVQSKALLDLLDLNSPPTDTVPSEVGPDCDNIKSTSDDVPESENKEAPANLTRPPRPSIAARPKNHVARDESCTVSRPAPPVQSKALLDLLDLNSPPTDTVPSEVGPDFNSIKTKSDEVPTKQEQPLVTVSDRSSVPQKPTIIRVSSKPDKLGGEGSAEPAPPLQAQPPVAGLASQMVPKSSLAPKSTLQPPAQECTNSDRPGGSLPLPPRPPGGKVLPPRPPPAKTPPGRPPPPQTAGHKRSPSKGAPKKGPPLPPRPCPGHPLYNSYTKKSESQVARGRTDGSNPERQTGDLHSRAPAKTRTPPADASSSSEPQTSGPKQTRRTSSGLQAQVLHDFTPESPNELALRVGDMVSMVERVDSDWYRGTCRGSSGIFPVNHVKTLNPSPANGKKERPVAAAVSGPRCMARFDYEAEQNDELSFSEGTVIRLTEYVDQDWVCGEVGGRTGIFPRNFVEVLEDLPTSEVPQPDQKTEVSEPTGLATSLQNQEAAKSCQSGTAEEEWALALYDFTAQTDEDLSFKQGAQILITEHVDSDWCCGMLNGKHGLFPKAFVQINCIAQAEETAHSGPEGGARAKALFNFTSECEEELSVQVGDIITSLESIDEEWFFGELSGTRGLIPKNYVEVLEDPLR